MRSADPGGPSGRRPRPAAAPREAESVASELARRGLERREQRTLAEQGRIWLGCTPVRALARPSESYPVTVQAERPRHRPDVDVAVVHREAELVVVYKPSGVLSTPAPGRREASVISTVQRWFRAAFAVHRIDEGTSGLLAVALTERMQSALKALFERHDIERRYLALVRGRPRWNETMVRSTLIRDRGDGLRGSGSGRHAEADATAREAITHLRAIESRGDLSLIEAKLETGRTHQVRIHLADQRFPILGDTLYGGARFERLALHAAILGFAHPLTQEPLRFVSPLPDALHTRLCSPR